MSKQIESTDLCIILREFIRSISYLVWSKIKTTMKYAQQRIKEEAVMAYNCNIFLNN
jgi:hypothetical protein